MDRLDNGIVSLYANRSGVVTSNFYDVSVVFSDEFRGEGDRFVVKEIAAVTMSWEHAKAMVANLQDVIKEYESKYGKIPVKG